MQQQKVFKICYSIWIYQCWEKKFDEADDEGDKANFGQKERV